MAVLEKDDVKTWSKEKCEREMRDRRKDVASIAESTGVSVGQSGWLAKLDEADSERVREHMASLNVIGDRFDEAQANESSEQRFAKLGDYLDNPDPEAQVQLPGAGARKQFEGKQAEAPRDAGAIFSESDALKAFVESGAKDKVVKIPTEALFGHGFSGIGEVPSLNAALFDSTGFQTRPDFRDDLLTPTLYQANNIGPLMAQGSTDSDTVKYPVETVTATGAAEVAEGSTKPEAQISFADTTEPVQTIAVLLPITVKALTNQPFLRAYINSRLRLFVQMREDSQLLNGNGTTPNIKGIFNRSGINTATSYSIGGANPDQALVEAIFHAAMRVRDSFLEPTAVAIKPSTWELAALAKDANRNYLLGGPGAAGYAGMDPVNGPRVWGLRVVLNANVPAQTATNKVALVGAWEASAMVIRRGTLDFAISDSHSTFFAENKLMLRVEEELALAVFRPAGFAAVTSAA